MYGKALGNGFAISALVGKKTVMDTAQDTFVSSVAWTEKVGFAAGLAVLQFHKKHKVFKANKMIGKRIKDGWIKLAKKHSLKIDVNTLDCVLNFNFQYKNKNEYLNTLFTELMLKHKFLATNLVYISYFHKKEIIDKYLSAVDKTFFQISKSIKNNKKILKSKVRSYNYKRVK